MSRADVDKPRDALAALRIPRTDPSRSSRSGRRWLRRLLILVVLLAMIAGGLYLGSQSGLLNVAEALQPKLEVRVANVSIETGRAGDAVVVATGYLESRQQAKIGARGVGRIETLDVEEGTPVKQDQILAVLEHNDLKAALSAAKATAVQSRAQIVEQEVEIARRKRDLDRAARLRGSPAMAESAYDDVRFQYEAAVARLASLEAAVTLAEARVAEAEQMIENMYVRAPFDGTVISKDAELGESIMPGGMGEASGRGSVVTIADLEHLEVDCDVKEDYISRVAAGQPAEVAVDAVPDRRYKGQVRKVIPMGDRARATIKVKVEILDADERLFPEMSSTVYFLPEASAAQEVAERRIFCPSDAVVTESEPGPSYVWLVNDEDRVRRMEVNAGAETSGRTEILDGLSGGEQVIIGPSPELREGQLVKVVD